MQRPNAVFALLVILSTIVGATAAADFGTEVNTVGNIVPTVQEQVTVNVERTAVVDGSLRIAIYIENPTGYRLELTGASFRLFNETESQIAHAPATRLDGGPSFIPPKGGLGVRYEVPLTPAQSEQVRTALDREDTRLKGRLGVVLNDEQFTIFTQPRPVDERRGS